MPNKTPPAKQAQRTRVPALLQAKKEMSALGARPATRKLASPASPAKRGPK